MPFSRRLAVAALALTLMACSDGASSGTAAPPTDAATGSAAEAGPVTVEHRYGSTTIESPPERIVSLDTQWTDVLVALDGPLVGAALDPVVEGGRYPWQQDLPGDVEPIPVGDALPFEAVAALQPDLIVVTWALPDEAAYERLTEIAPTIPLLGEEQVDAWQDIAQVAGQVLGRPDEAAGLVEDADRLSADVLADLPALDGKTYALANYVPGDAIYVVADPDDGAGIFFGQLGLAIDPDLLAIADGAAGRAKLSLERIDELDADVLVILTNGAAPEDIPGYATLPAVQAGAVALLDVADITGLNTPTPLSIPHSLERIRPALEAAAGAGQ